MSKIIKHREEVREKIVNAVNLLTEPVVATLSPLGSNTLYEDSMGGLFLTNDGVTIAKQIHSDDEIENSIIEVLRHASLKTNAEAGDGTTTTTLFESVLIKEGLKLIDDGIKPITLKRDFEELANTLVGKLQAIEVKDDEDLRHVALVSSGGDEEIATYVLDVVKTAGEDGMVLIQDTNKGETILEKESGFIVDGGLLSPEYAQHNGFSSKFDDCHVLVCDKRLYYEEEAETILRVAIENGIKNLVIVARDFIGKAPNVFSANHLAGSIQLILVKDSRAGDSSHSMKDLSVYLNGVLITEKSGKLVDSLTVNDFCEASAVFANPHRTVITTKDINNPDLLERIKMIHVEKEKDPDNDELKRRLAALTNGVVTVKVGGATPIEMREKMFRYEDAINATRSALKYGYLPGAGMGILAAFDSKDYKEEYRPLMRRLCESSVRQIAKNSGQHEDYVINNTKPAMFVGYNAKTGAFEDVVDAGIIDPYKVTEMAIKNSFSVAAAILSSEWFITNKNDDKDKGGE